ncbi:unnamed protein product, partial [Rotaria sp. Silwood2]
LLERMTRDIAEYFIERGKRLRKDHDSNGALLHLHWAKRLFEQYDKTKQGFTTDNPQAVKESDEAKEINRLIADIEHMAPGEPSPKPNNNADDD